MRTAVTKDGDTFDQLALAAYGATAGYTETLIAANPDLAARPPVLPAGLVVSLPDIAPPSTAATVSLWD